jgi:hypothetical protein
MKFPIILAAAVVACSFTASASAQTYYGSIVIDDPVWPYTPVYSKGMTTGPLNFSGTGGGASAFVAANNWNSGTVIATGSTTQNPFYAEAIYTAPLLLTGPSGSAVRVRMKAFGQIASMGSGDANVLFRVLNGSTEIFRGFRDVNSETTTRTSSVNFSTSFILPANTPYSYVLNAWSRSGRFGASDPASAYAFLDPEISFSPVSGVPEPGAWALLIAGFGLVGATQRRRRHAIA